MASTARVGQQKLFAGAAIKRLRLRGALSQATVAEQLGISASYLNLIERNARPLTAQLLLRVAELFMIDPRDLTRTGAEGGVEGLRRRLGDPRFADLGVDREEVDAWLAAAPRGAEAFARAFDLLSDGNGTEAARPDPVGDVRAAIERWQNYFAELDEATEALADELRLGSGNLFGAIVERLRVKHSLMVRVLPVEALPDRLRRFDLHARQVQLSELLDPASRTFAAAHALGQIEARTLVDALVRGARLARPAERLFRRHLSNYWAAALMMPYGRFLRACETTGYDLELLQRRFLVGFEQLTHRLTTLNRVGARGLPFFMLRLDRAGQVSKRYAGASQSPLAAADGRCPLWDAFAAFERPGRLMRSLVELEDESRWFTLARTVAPQAAQAGAVRAEFAVIVGLRADLAAPLAAASGLDLAKGSARFIGLGCRACTRPACPQRSAPPAARALVFNERERGLSAYDFVAD